jgi:hypothetical protein
MGFYLNRGDIEMKKIMIGIIVMSCFLAFTVSTVMARDTMEQTDDRNNLIGKAIGAGIDGLFELGKTIKDAKSSSNSNPKLVLGKELDAFRINSTYQVLLSEGTYNDNPCFVFSAYDEKIKKLHYVGYEKNDPEDMQKIADFNKMNVSDKKIFIKEKFLKFAKVNLGEIDPEPAASAQKAPAAKQEQSSATSPASK